MSDRVTKNQLIAYTVSVSRQSRIPLIIDWSYGQPCVRSTNGTSITTRDTKTVVYWQLRAVAAMLWQIDNK